MLPTAGVVILVLTVSNADTGVKLEERTELFEKREVWSDTIEDCRRAGVEAAHERSRYYRANVIPNATSNVNCSWLKGGAPA